MEITLTESNFETEVLKSEKPVLVDFWASWCGPCKMLAPTIEQIANENDTIKDGEVAKTSMGFVPKETLEALFKE